MRFLSPFRMEWLTGEELRAIGASARRAQGRLLEPLRFCAGGNRMFVPEGFVTDFASVPRLLWSLLSPTDPRYMRAAVVHDYGYRNGGRYPAAGGVRALPTRREVDRLFLEAMAVEGSNWLVRNLIYRSVRLFGARHWISKKGVMK